MDFLWERSFQSFFIACWHQCDSLPSPCGSQFRISDTERALNGPVWARTSFYNNQLFLGGQGRIKYILSYPIPLFPDRREFCGEAYPLKYLPQRNKRIWTGW